MKRLASDFDATAVPATYGSVSAVTSITAVQALEAAASASYIAVPAVLRFAIPEAEVGLYLGLSLGVTFPLNILLGIPLYLWRAQQLLH